MKFDDARYAEMLGKMVEKESRNEYIRVATEETMQQQARSDRAEANRRMREEMRLRQMNGQQPVLIQPAEDNVVVVLPIE